MLTLTMIPELENWCGSWVVSRKDGTVVGEFFEVVNVLSFDREKFIVETSAQYLGRVNKGINATK